MRQSQLKRLLVWLGLALPAAGWAQAPEIAVELPGGVPLEMVWIEPGTFVMGGEPDLVARNSTLGPQHTVTLTKGFYLGRFEVTQAQWSTVMGTQPWLNRGGIDCSDCPATEISSEDAKAFLYQLNLSSKDPVLYRLPTESEWEYAARAGTTTAWSFGDNSSDLNQYGWYRDNTCTDGANECLLHEVGLKLPNSWGLYDMHGNVYEWVEDWWLGQYPDELQTDPVSDIMPVFNDPSLDAHRVIRGGAYSSAEVTTRSGFRTSEVAIIRWNNIGFRIAASLSPTTQVPPSGWGAVKTVVKTTEQPPK